MSKEVNEMNEQNTQNHFNVIIQTMFTKQQREKQGDGDKKYMCNAKAQITTAHKNVYLKSWTWFFFALFE